MRMTLFNGGTDNTSGWSHSPKMQHTCTRCHPSKKTTRLACHVTRSPLVLCPLLGSAWHAAVEEPHHGPGGLHIMHSWDGHTHHFGVVWRKASTTKLHSRKHMCFASRSVLLSRSLARSKSSLTVSFFRVSLVNRRTPIENPPNLKNKIKY